VDLWGLAIQIVKWVLIAAALALLVGLVLSSSGGTLFSDGIQTITGAGDNSLTRGVGSTVPLDVLTMLGGAAFVPALKAFVALAGGIVVALIGWRVIQWFV